MFKITLLLIFIPTISFGQNIYKNRIKSLSDTSNYVDNNIRSLIVDRLKLDNLDPQNYFIDSVVLKKGDTLYIHLVDSQGLKYLDEIEEKNKKNAPYQINVLGNPGNFRTVEYDIKRRKVLGLLIPQ